MTQATRSNLMSVATTLAANIDATQDYIPVASTTNFSTSIVAEIETTNEVVSFTDISSNIFPYSQDFTNAAWTKNNITLAANDTTAPDGTTTATKMTEDTSSGNHRAYHGEGSQAAAAHTNSVFLKKDSRSWGLLGFNNRPDSSAWYDLENGVVGSTQSNVSNAIEDVGNGWYRCIITLTGAFSTAVYLQFGPTTGDNVGTYLGAAESIFAWGAQVELGTSASTYLPTTSAGLVGLTDVTRGVNGTTAASASSGDAIQQLPYALLNVDMPVRLTGLSVSSDGTGAGRLTLCDKVGTHLCDVDIPDTKIFDLTFDGGILFPNGIYVANSDNITAYTLYTDKYSGDSL